MRMIRVNDEIVLKPLSLSSAKTIFDCIDQSRNHLRPWLPFVDQTITVNDTRSYIKSVLNSTCSKKDKVFEIWHNQAFAGLIGFKEIDQTNLKAEIGYWLDQAKTGQGIMIMSCSALIDYAFSKVGLNRLSMKVATGNVKSTAIPLGLGFSREGIEHDGELINDKFYDLHVFSLLKKDRKK